MHERALRRAAGATAAILLLSASMAVADTVPADGDEVTAGVQDFLEIGPIGTGGTVTAAIGFDLTCNTASHVDPGQSVIVGFGVPDVPDGGAATGSGTTVGPVGAAWPSDGSLCPASATPIHSALPATVTLTAPPEPGVYDYIVNFTRSLVPAGAADGTAVRGLSRVFFELTVVPDAAPGLVLPLALTVEGDTTGGAVVEFSVAATDTEDATPPTAVCAPASGSFFALGDTTVTCTATDTAGHVSAGTFAVSVVDTTAPVLVGVPAGVSIVTGQAGGAAAAYAPPTATDVVDPSPVVVCSPAPGAVVPVGTTAVACSAEDASHNVAAAIFPLVVTYQPPVVLEATFDEPVGAGGVLVGTSGRTVPVKAHVLRDGRPVTTGLVQLRLSRCDDGLAVGGPRTLAWQGERWTLGLDTSGLAGCLRVTVSADGVDAGAFELHLAASASVLKAREARR